MRQILKSANVFLLFILFSGCAKVAHLDQLLTLKAYSDNKDAQEKFVQTQNKKFEKLLAAAKDGTISRYRDRKAVLTDFGEPILTRSENKDGQDYERWLYRYPTKFFDSQKVYLYFDSAGQLKKWDLEDSRPKTQATTL